MKIMKSIKKMSTTCLSRGKGDVDNQFEATFAETLGLSNQRSRSRKTKENNENKIIEV